MHSTARGDHHRATFTPRDVVHPLPTFPSAHTTQPLPGIGSARPSPDVLVKSYQLCKYKNVPVPVGQQPVPWVPGEPQHPSQAGIFPGTPPSRGVPPRAPPPSSRARAGARPDLWGAWKSVCAAGCGPQVGSRGAERSPRTNRKPATGKAQEEKTRQPGECRSKQGCCLLEMDWEMALSQGGYCPGLLASFPLERHIMTTK